MINGVAGGDEPARQPEEAKIMTIKTAAEGVGVNRGYDDPRLWRPLRLRFGISDGIWLIVASRGENSRRTSDGGDINVSGKRRKENGRKEGRRCHSTPVNWLSAKISQHYLKDRRHRRVGIVSREHRGARNAAPQNDAWRKRRQRIKHHC